MRYSLALLTLSLNAWAGARPAWTFSTPRADQAHKYYVGRALDEASEKEAWRSAREAAQEAAVRENFGVETSIASSSFESAKEVALDKRVSENFPKVRLVNFEQIDSYSIERDGRHNVWVLFRYPVRQIDIERERISGAGAGAAETPFNEAGGVELSYSTALEVTSEPGGVPVFIDSERWGVTPLRVAGTLSPGVHRVRLSHPSYKDAEGEVVLVKGATGRVHQRLRPAVGYLKVNSEPEGAEILIDGVARGQAPVGPFEVLVGRPKRIEARHPGHETQIQIVEVQKDEIRRVQFQLNPVRRFDSFEEFDRDENGHRRAWILGFLVGLSEPSLPSPEGVATLQLGLTVEKRFLWYFGLRAGATYDMASEETEESRDTRSAAIEGSGTFVGLPIYLTSRTKGFYLMPEIGKIHHDRLRATGATSTTPQYAEMNATRKGARFGYMNMDAHVDIWVAGHAYDWRDQGVVNAVSAGITFTFNDGGNW